MAPARASGVASDPCAAAMRTMTSAYAAMTRLCSLAYPNHATPPSRRSASARAAGPRVGDPRMGPAREVPEERAAVDVDGIPGHLDRGVVDVGAGRDVPAPGVPGAGHHAPVELALAERPAPVGARVVDRVVRAVHVEQGQRLALDLDHPALARRHVADGGDPYPSRLCHRSRSSRRRPYSITPRRPLWLPIYQRRPSASTIIFRIPTSFDGSVKTRSASVFGSRRTTVSVWISLTHTAPAPSIVTAYGPPRSPAGSGYSFTTFCAAGSTRTSLPLP